MPIILMLLISALLACTDHRAIPGSGGFQKLTVEDTTLKESNSIALNRQLGVVVYWPHKNQYAINFTIEGTIDSINSGLVENLDEQYQKPGLKVIVSGKLYKTPDLPPPMLGGQEIFFLEISKLSIAE